MQIVKNVYTLMYSMCTHDTRTIVSTDLCIKKPLTLFPQKTCSSTETPQYSLKFRQKMTCIIISSISICN